MVAAFLWLGAAWGVSAGFDFSAAPSRASSLRSIQVFSLLLAAGALVAWPLARLSLPTPSSIGRTILLDACVIIVLAHVTLFPLRAISGWSRDRLLLLDASLLSGIAIVGSILLVGLRSDRALRRTLAALAIVFLAIGPEAPWVALDAASPSVARALPGALPVAWVLAEPIPGPPSAALARDALAAAIIAAATLITALAWHRRPVTLA